MSDDLVGVSCCKCSNFIPDKIGDGGGAGMCKVIVWIRANRPEEERYYYTSVLGNKFFWGGDDGNDDRYCKKFKPLDKAL